jgi:hypothetical protein
VFGGYWQNVLVSIVRTPPAVGLQVVHQTRQQPLLISVSEVVQELEDKNDINVVT